MERRLAGKGLPQHSRTWLIAIDGPKHVSFNKSQPLAGFRHRQSLAWPHSSSGRPSRGRRADRNQARQTDAEYAGTPDDRCKPGEP
jgi:hypothetical protein